MQVGDPAGGGWDDTPRTNPWASAIEARADGAPRGDAVPQLAAPHGAVAGSVLAAGGGHRLVPAGTWAGGVVAGCGAELGRAQLYSVVVLATTREGADVTGTVERLLAAGVRPPQILLLNSADPPQQLADFYRTFLLQPGVRALAPATKLRPRPAGRHGAAAAPGPGLDDLQWRQQQHLAECSAIESAARQVLGGATWGRWDSDWMLILTDDSSLRFRDGAGRALGAALRGYYGCSRGIVALEDDAPGVTHGYAFHRRVLGRMEHIASAICAARAKELPAEVGLNAAPTVQSVLQQIVKELSSTGSDVATLRGLTYRENDSSLRPAGIERMKAAASLRCPAADEIRVMVAVPTFNRPRCAQSFTF